MNWLLSLMLIAVLVAFNMYAADTMVHLRRDVKEIHRAVVYVSAPKAAAASAPARPTPAPAPAHPAPAPVQPPSSPVAPKKA
jgi:hypothetical protein